MTGTPIAFFRGEYVPLSEAKVSVMTHALHYGTAVFEGIRGNWNEDDQVINIFRQKEHYERLIRGCQLMMLDIPYDCEEMCDITAEIVKRSGAPMDVCVRAGLVAEAYLQANDEGNYKHWKAIEKKDCAAAGL